MKYMIMEVGSTNTKSYSVEDGVVSPLRLDTIEWKNHYKQAGHILEEDIQKLYDVIHAIEEDNVPIYIYGTSIFRNISEEERTTFIHALESETKATFQVVSAEEESDLTTYGAVADIDNDLTVAVMIGGGGSTELSIVKNKEVLENVYYDFGAMDVVDRYPKIGEDIAQEDIDACIEELTNEVQESKHKVEVLLLAGGDYLKFYHTMEYELEKNTYYESALAKEMITKEKALAYDKDFFYKKALSDVKKKDTKNPDWWGAGTRGMRICVEVLANVTGAKIIIPTSINMVYGIVAKLEEQN